ncbi:unnamed protein product [Blepharisma stoltei]|uniref:Aurora kinase n=1 Tax=Blepharisma stoltei TaxID=1481888 RepID=A0AAU9JEP1_9CILI|nr:unnamed protein product [Blepharisma stoltei]
MSCSNPSCQNKADDFEICPRCNAQHYCSSNCRRIDWISKHQFECQKPKIFTLKDFREIEDSQQQILGKGTYGEVRLVQHQESGQYYALKQIKKDKYIETSSVDILRREIEIHKTLNHPNIIQLIQFFEDEEFVYILLEYAARGSLFHLIRRQRGLPEEKAWKYFTQTCIGIKYMHDNHFIHRDMKPENILLDGNDNVKICDFGWCTQSNETRNTFCGTLDYMAPEMILSNGHSFEVDIWALGVLLFELIHGYPPFRSIKDTEKCKQIINAEVKFKNNLSDQVQDLILKILQKEAKDRLSLLEILTHPWVELYVPDNEFEPNVKVRHPEYGEGVILEAKGLIVFVYFPEKSFTLKITISDAMSILKIIYENESELNEEDFRDTAGGLGLGLLSEKTSSKIQGNNHLEILAEKPEESVLISEENVKESEEEEIEIIENFELYREDEEEEEEEEIIEIEKNIAFDENEGAGGLFLNDEEIDSLIIKRQQAVKLAILSIDRPIREASKRNIKKIEPSPAIKIQKAPNIIKPVESKEKPIKKSEPQNQELKDKEKELNRLVSSIENTNGAKRTNYRAVEKPKKKEKSGLGSFFSGLLGCTQRDKN